MAYLKHLTFLSVTLTSALAMAQAKQRPEAPPPAPRVLPVDNGVIQQAGVGSRESFARAGVLELGGSASLTAASDFTQFSLAPSVGWFFMDNWQLSGIVSWNTIKVGDQDAAHLFSLLAEPSFHLPFNDTNFGFVGMGFGVTKQTGKDAGLAFAPRIGYKTMVGRSGMLTADLRNTFSTNDVVETSQGTAISVSSAFALGLGYTVLW